VDQITRGDKEMAKKITTMAEFKEALEKATASWLDRVTEESITAAAHDILERTLKDIILSVLGLRKDYGGFRVYDERRLLDTIGQKVRNKVADLLVNGALLDAAITEIAKSKTLTKQLVKSYTNGLRVSLTKELEDMGARKGRELAIVWAGSLHSDARSVQEAEQQLLREMRKSPLFPPSQTTETVDESDGD